MATSVSRPRIPPPPAVVALLVVGSAALTAAPALAQEDPPTAAVQERQEEDGELEWSYPRFRPVEYVVAFGAPLVFRLLDHNTREATSARWEGPILLDGPVRDLLLAGSASARDRLARVSDYLWYGSMALPVLDTLVTPLLVHGSPSVAWQMMAINIGAYALNGFVTLLSIRATARERPAQGPCAEDPDYIERCDSGPLRSFPSGHTSGAFAGAGLYCAHHTSLPLYGGGLPDVAACAAALTMASGVALFRVGADRHYLSDVVVGAGIGLGVGWLLPWLLHYRHGTPAEVERPDDPNAVRAMAMPWTDGQAAGIDLFAIY